MKAVLEINMPKSCYECPLGRGIFERSCRVLNRYISGGYRASRSPMCPLKVLPSCAQAPRLENGKCAGYQKGEMDDEPSEMCMKCPENQFYEDAGELQAF